MLRASSRRSGSRIALLALATLALPLAAQGPGYLPPLGPRPVPPLTLPQGANPELAGAVAGGVPGQPVSATPIALSLDNAVGLGLRNNLTALLAASQSDEARAQHYAMLSALLPRVDAGAGEIREKINLAAFGLSNFPGVASIVGPFDVFNAELSASSSLFNLSARNTERAAAGLVTAARDAQQEARDLVVLAVLNQYLLTVADESRVQAAQSELDTANHQLTQAKDMLSAGTVDALVVVRANVQQQSQQQQLLAAQDGLAKQRLALARAIGLPLAQTFTLTDRAPYAAMTAPPADTAIAQALATRPDYRAAEAAVAAARWAMQAAKDERLPTLSVDGSYGPVGREIVSNHPVYTAAATVTMPLLEGGLFKADTLQARTQLNDAEHRAADLRVQVEQEVRDALDDISSVGAQVEVARSARDLTQQELTMAGDRFQAGVANNLEVVEAQQAVAEADEHYIQSLYGYNLAKASLARALGVAQAEWRQYVFQP